MLPAASFDACISDPPYGIGIAAWDSDVPTTETWAEVLRVMKPGAWLVAFGARRTFHRLATRVEDAGFKIVDMGAWVYANGRPPSKVHLKPAHEPIELATGLVDTREEANMPKRSPHGKASETEVYT